MMKSDTLNITIPSGHEIDLENSNLVEGIIRFKPIKNKLPMSWEEFDINYNLKREYLTDREFETGFKQVWIHNHSKYVALRKLEILRDIWREGWDPDWKDGSVKWCVEGNDNNPRTYSCFSVNEFLSFQTKEKAELFLETFKDLIEEAKDLI